MSNFASMREQMVESQLKPNRITDLHLLEIMSNVPREEFLPISFSSIAYADDDIEWGKKFFVLRPMLQAKLILALDLAPHDNVLYIGNTSAYIPAVLEGLCSKVTCLRDPSYSSLFGSHLTSSHVEYMVGSLQEGFAKSVPYDAVIIEGGIEFIPDLLLNQLKEDGKIVALLKKTTNLFNATLIHQNESVILFEAKVPLLCGFERNKEFIF